MKQLIKKAWTVGIIWSIIYMSLKLKTKKQRSIFLTILWLSNPALKFILKK